MDKVVKLVPFYKETVWGSESWVTSTHISGESLFEDKKLSSFVELNYLTKIIETHKDLSIQVHPNMKSECWLILDHLEGAGVFLGFKNGVTKKEFKNALESGVKIDSYLNFIKVKKGDFFFVPPGAIHAIGKNLKLLEVQDSSNLTYRLWDWKRVGKDGLPRQLDQEKALEILDFDFKRVIYKNIYSVDKLLENFFSFKGISLDILKVSKSLELNMKKGESIYLLNGNALINNKRFDKKSFIALENEQIKITAKEESTFIIVR